MSFDRLLLIARSILINYGRQHGIWRINNSYKFYLRGQRECVCRKQENVPVSAFQEREHESFATYQRIYKDYQHHLCFTRSFSMHSLNNNSKAVTKFCFLRIFYLLTHCKKCFALSVMQKHSWIWIKQINRRGEFRRVNVWSADEIRWKRRTRS